MSKVTKEELERNNHIFKNLLSKDFKGNALLLKININGR